MGICWADNTFEEAIINDNNKFARFGIANKMSSGQNFIIGADFAICMNFGAGDYYNLTSAYTFCKKGDELKFIKTTMAIAKYCYCEELYTQKSFDDVCNEIGIKLQEQ